MRRSPQWPDRKRGVATEKLVPKTALTVCFAHPDRPRGFNPPLNGSENPACTALTFLQLRLVFSVAVSGGGETMRWEVPA
jgi:hypothetical protein